MLDAEKAILLLFLKRTLLEDLSLLFGRFGRRDGLIIFHL